jgi:hypothetical protein
MIFDGLSEDEEIVRNLKHCQSIKQIIYLYFLIFLYLFKNLLSRLSK